MAKQIPVLLLENISGLGKAGDIVEVAEAYARNALFPQGKAALATANIKQEKETKDSKKRAQAEAELQAMQATAEKLDATEISTEVKVNDDQEPYGSITAKTVSELLKDQAQVDIAPKNIKSTFPIKELGTFPLTIQLGQGVEFTMTLVVLKDDEA